MAVDGQSPLMITPAYLRACSLAEAGAEKPYAGVCEGAVGKPAVRR